MANIECLQQLRRVVEEVPDHLFHMRNITEEASCGTAHCALRWAMVDPWFQQNTKITEISPINCWVTFRKASRIFDITEFDTDHLFGVDLGTGPSLDPHAVSKAEVIANIDRLLHGMPAEPYDAVFDCQDNDDDDC